MPKRNSKAIKNTKRKPTKEKPSNSLESIAQAEEKSPVSSQDSKLSNNRFPIVGVGASAGGLEAFKQLLAVLPVDTGIAFVLVQHLTPKHESMLTELLSRTTRLPVQEVTDGLMVRPNHIYVIPPNATMSIEEGVLRLHPLGEGQNRHMIDYFFRSLAEDQQSRAMGVILSGTASDGTLGLQAIKAQGGITFAQDDQSAKYSAMPRSAIAAGNVDFILPPEQIVRELIRISRYVHVTTAEESPGRAPASADENLLKIFALLKSVSGVDFSSYKQETVKRRITRRMFLLKLERLDEYVRLLRKDHDEVQSLFQDVLINVTGFFRDPEAFTALKKVAFPALMHNHASSAPIRIWVPGCSTGEETYSIAICLLEYLGDLASSTQIQIFATDVSESIVQKARAGIYPISISANVSAERLHRFFHKADGSYQINKAIQDMCVFAKQDITRDPPFSKLDLISCRNVMIYMGGPLHKKIIPLFHYALNPDGILFLGSSETVGNYFNLFFPIDKKNKIYSRKSLAVPLHFDFIPHFNPIEGDLLELATKPPARVTSLDIQRVADQMLLHRYAPASLVVNDSLDIVQFIGQTGPFLEPAPGNATLNLLKMVKAGLQLELRSAFQKVKREGIVRKEGLIIQHNERARTVNFEVVPIRDLPDKERYYLVVFEDVAKPSTDGTAAKKQVKNGKKALIQKDAGEPITENQRLSEELDATREYLQSIIEEQRTTNEELRSANEEIQSSNDELQSINEELETAKEELQSTNEELTTVNEELQNRNEELTQLNNDLSNLLSSVSIPIVMLGNDLRIRRFTPMAERVMNLIATDIGRPITDIKPNLKLGDLKDIITEVFETLNIRELQVEDFSGKWYVMKVRPYRTVDNRIEGVVVVLLDVLHQ
jgi:two-component system, chemotaxis family, CheB/CheR fusion protein